jgi:2,3-bisphosphoglycerate-independent phosphoglycerate mutase
VKPPGYGESQPRLDDDRLPVVLVVLDGLGDRPSPRLGDRTPSEAATTPVLDDLARRGCSGWHLPFGWGLAPASELAHWAMFGFADVPFPGRAVLEALGAGLEVESGMTMAHAALRTSYAESDRVWITGRAAATDESDAAELMHGLEPVLRQHGATLRTLGSSGEALLSLPGHATGAITDSDPFFEDFHPWLRVLPADAAAEATAEKINELLLDARELLCGSPVNRQRRSRGLPPLDVLTTKWAGSRQPIPDFVDRTGVSGALVTSSRLYRGLARILGMSHRHLAPADDVAGDLRTRLSIAEEMLAEGARFVHVHTKATDVAGHLKDPRAKRDVIEAADAGLAGLSEIAERAIVAITGDHATPSTDGVLHTGDPTPLVVVGPTVRGDPVVEFGEAPAAGGWYGTLRAAELLPLLLGHANRPAFLGHRATARPTLGLPDQPVPMAPRRTSEGT